MAKSLNGVQRFRPGRRGACEAVLFEFVNNAPESGESQDPLGFRLIAAASLAEATVYLAKVDPEFRPALVRRLGIVILLSGSPTA